MKTRLEIALTLVACLAAPSALAARSPEGIWTDVDARSVPAGAAARPIQPRVFRTVVLNRAALDERLSLAPMAGTPAAERSEVILELPSPGGSFERYRVWESPVLAEPLARRFPQIRTWAGQGLDDPTASARFDVTDFGFHAIVLSETGTVYIDPLQRGDVDHYISYFKRDLPRPAGKEFHCDFAKANPEADLRPQLNAPIPPSGTELRTYRVAIAATGEYTAYYGGTQSGALSGITTTLNRVDAIYEREVSVHMTLVANETAIIYTNAATDPYTNSDGAAMLDQNQATLDSRIGSANYDIGHVVSTGGGGIAALGVVCVSGYKAQGVTGSPQPVGDAFDVDYVAHEMGHQFGASHTFNADGAASGSCDQNRDPQAAYEPGSGSTIMAYAGICAGEDLQAHSDDYFHVKSLDEILTLVSSLTCSAVTPTGNQPPTVNPPSGNTIPAKTPFSLTASGTDPNGDPLTYTWEEYDLGAAAPPDTDDGRRPIFRSWKGTTSPTRTFPRLSDLLAGTSTFGESLPTLTRTLSFRVTGRDNRAGGGGVSDAAVALNVVDTGAAFAVTAPAAGAVWPAGSLQDVLWDVAGTTTSPINCSAVNITLSTDGGATFATTVATNVANNGKLTTTVPGVSSSMARLMISCAGNLFFNVSSAFSIPGTPSVCTPSPTNLCLNTNRFKVSVAYKNQYAGGATGNGVAEALTSDTGYFWFFSNTNVEIIVKVLDGRAINGKFWVFYGALSDLEYTITITDTQTGAVKSYYNPPYRLGSLADTNAF